MNDSRLHFENDDEVENFNPKHTMSKTIKIPARFPNETVPVNVEIDPKNLKDVVIFNDEVFATIEEIRIAIDLDDYNKLFEDTDNLS